jgi:hypothetical protein
MAFLFLDRYVEDLNNVRQLFNRAGHCQHKLSLTNAKDRKFIREQLECDLSPENLCCDGELSGARLQVKSKYLNGALRELNKLEGKQ